MQKLPERLFTGDVSGSINPNRVKAEAHPGVILVITDGPEKVDPKRVKEVADFMRTYPGNGGSH